MIDFAKPTELFNPVTATDPLTPVEILAGPMGLLIFLPLAPLVRLAARRWPRTALIAGSLLWHFLTVNLLAIAFLLAGVMLAAGYLIALWRLRQRGVLGKTAMIAAVWIGLHLLVLPLWWYGSPDWYESRMAVLHSLGFAYFLLRFIAWGVDWAREPERPLRLIDTICWILYPPCLRLGPVMRREAFFERFDTWQPAGRTDWRTVARRLGWFLLGGVGLAVVARNLPTVGPDMPSFFESPGAFDTEYLARAFYLIPIQIYLLLWTYNELAAVTSRLVGIRVDNNFDHLPRSASVKEFWRRWHITVGAWMRDYIYIPIGGNRVPGLISFSAVFLYCGAWHGAAWSFVAWGASQALALTVQRWWEAWKRRWTWKPPRALVAGGAAVAWVVTMHYQLATIVMFVDYYNLGAEFFPALLRRLF